MVIFNYIIVRLFFCLHVILLHSCLPTHLRVGHSGAIKKSIPQTHLDAFLKKFKVVGIDQAGEKETIEALKLNFTAQKTGIPRIMEPFFGKSQTSDAITILTKITDYPKDKVETLLDLVKSIAIINSHLYLGMESLSLYVNNKESFDHRFTQKTFLKIEDIALKAKARFEAGEMFGDVMYEALKDTTQYVESLSRKASYSGCKRNDDFHAKIKYTHAKILNGYKHYLNVIKNLFYQHKEARLAITYAQHIYKNKFEKLHIIGKLLELCRTIGDRYAAQFYLETISILEVTTSEDAAREKIDNAFEKAKAMPMPEVDDLVAQIEGLKIPKPQKTKEITIPTKSKKKTNISPSKKRKNNQKQDQLSCQILKDTTQENHNENFFYSIPDQHEEELHQETMPIQSVAELQQRFDKSRFKLHGRVLRWSGATIDAIKKFDTSYKHQRIKEKIPYANLSEKDITLQKAYHDLQGVELLLFVDDHKDYFFKTPKGKSAFASLEIEGAIYEGMLELGISNEGNIYHMMFNDNVKHKPEQLFQITNPMLEYLFEDSLENDHQFGQWCNKDRFAIEKKDRDYVITLDMPTSTMSSNHHAYRRLFIHPNKLSTKYIKIY